MMPDATGGTPPTVVVKNLFGIDSVDTSIKAGGTSSATLTAKQINEMVGAVACDGSTAGAIASALVSRFEHLQAEVARLTQEQDEARITIQARDGTLMMAVHRLEGLVEGAQTHRGNFLQRIDALRRIESDLDICKQILSADMTAMDGPLPEPAQPLTPVAMCLFGAIHELRDVRARLATLTEKVTEYETRPWPGCLVLSLGDACDCSLCQSEHKLAALTAALDGLELELLDHAHSYEEQIEGTTAEDFEFMSDLSKLVAGWADSLAAMRTPEGK